VAEIRNRFIGGAAERPTDADWYIDGEILNPGGKF